MVPIRNRKLQLFIFIFCLNYLQLALLYRLDLYVDSLRAEFVLNKRVRLHDDFETA